MTRVIPFLPSNLNAPRFRAVLDGDDYDVLITWNISAQRYYLNIYGTDNTWIVTVPMFASPPSRMVSSAVYNPFLKAVVVKFVDPTLWPVPLAPGGLNIRPGTIIEYTMMSFSPDAYNGKYQCLHIDNLTFSYPMEIDPGPTVVLGSVNRILNMVAGVFQTSSLIYRDGMFEINP